MESIKDSKKDEFSKKLPLCIHAAKLVEVCRGGGNLMPQTHTGTKVVRQTALANPASILILRSDNPRKRLMVRIIQPKSSRRRHDK
jgi:hypothetical protein